MQKSIGIAVVWLVTLGAAWYVGREMAPEPDAAPNTILENEPARIEESGPSLRGEAMKETPEPAVLGAPVAKATQLPTLELDLENVPEDFVLDPKKSIAELSREFMAWVAVQLGRGKTGHMAILDKINEFTHDKEFERRMRDERGLQPLMYGWVRFLVDRDRQIVDLTETVFETMAEKPQRFETYDDDTLEVFTEGVAVLLPSMVSEDRLERFRTHAKKVLETPEAEQSEAVRRNRNEVERMLVWMQAPLTPEEAFAKFQAKEYSSPREAQHLLAQMTPEQKKQLDVDALLGPMLSQGDWGAFRQLSEFAPTGRELDRLDQRMYDGVAAGRLQNWHLRTYLSETGRRDFASAKDFLERGLGAGGKGVDAYALAAQNLQNVPKEWVVWCIDRHDLQDQTVRSLKARFGIQ